MPTLNWIGKDKVVNHHIEVPYKVLEHSYGFDGHKSKGEIGCGNKIIHGDNLEALKSLLPEYEGKIKCIYIDPPYNTGNEGWKYNDSVNDPKIKKWLGETVGKEGEDLTRHDKWLCMMYPRLKLLQKLLSDDGVIFISIDDHEYQNLKFICDELFGRINFVTNFTWRTDGNFDNQAKIKINHEYVLCYSKNIELFEHPKVVDPNVPEASKLFRSEIRNTVVKNGPKNPISIINLPIGFPSDIENGTIKARNSSWPHYKEDAIIKNGKLNNSVAVSSGWSSKGILEKFIKKDFLPVKDSKGQETTFVISKTGAIENIKSRGEASHVVSSLFNMGSTQNMSAELKKIGVNFDYPKSLTLIQYLISIINGENFIVLDSFAGSGTTGHAVLNLNKDGRNRKFILIEMMDYVEEITSVRLQHVINGYSDQNATGGSFDFYNLGDSIFDVDGHLNEQIDIEKIRKYVYYTETTYSIERSTNSDNKYFLGMTNLTAYYLFYEPKVITTLDYGFLATVKTAAEQYIVYADNCLLPKDFMIEKNIVFKKIPRDITKF
ncbi:site-specific DNA-methyltransferase [Pedobacter mucosus]|uniref:site-specific DNA-methyltransferase n=1 Tax=Pedobacter mucosus TaxID=2895286 RepID=UPI001EE481B6|nr:site-specific DNA-methyltransferase [Pedobacter mucosus]UKT62719.1 site-specific DNA-methyltransferase [Pedobacter mucosus]